MNSNIQIIANGRAKGMIDPETRETFVELVKKELPGAGLEFIDEGTKVSDLVRVARQRGATIIAAGGGDGTINSVARELVGTSVTLGVLPLGTLNHFAKDLGIPQDASEALALLANGTTTEVDVGTIGDRIFLNNSGLGLYPDMVFNREQLQKGGVGKWAAVFVESARAFRRYKLVRLSISVEGKDFHCKTPAIFVGNNDYSLEGTLASKRTTLNDGQLCLYIPHTPARSRLLWLSVRAFFGNPKAGTDFDKFLTTEFTIDSPQRQMHVSIDGEVETMTTPLKYGIKPRSLRVIVPNPSAETAGENDEGGK